MNPLRPILPARTRSAVAPAALVADTGPEPQEAATVSSDPRFGPLLDLVQGLLNGYDDLSLKLAEQIPDLNRRSKFVAEAQRTTETARARYMGIINGERV